ncbi:MAG: ABC transporter substrate-binding protein [Chloroflexi bacterium]|nr:ABC transporter substrate-binding protein [Chloroflexota bacterium]
MTAPTVGPTLSPTPSTPLKIGVLVPYTESSISVDVGLNQKRAADLYLKNTGGWLGSRPTSLVYSAESIEAAINKVKVNTLLNTEKVDLLLGGARDETAAVMRDAADAAKLVFIDTNATSNALTRANASKYLFRTSASAWQLSAPLGEWASRNGTKEFFVCAVDNATGLEFADAFVSGVGKNGGKATARATFASGGDWSKAIAQIKGQATRNVFAAFDTDDAEGFLGEWMKQGLSSAGFTLSGPGFLTEQPVLDASTTVPVGVLTTHFWSPDVDNPENKALVDQFPHEYVDDETGAPVALSGYAVAMWDAMTALDIALKDAQDAPTLVTALEAVSFKSPRGMFTFSKSHNPVHDIVIRETRSVPNAKATNVVVDRLPLIADPG